MTPVTDLVVQLSIGTTLKPKREGDRDSKKFNWQQEDDIVFKEWNKIIVCDIILAYLAFNEYNTIYKDADNQ